NYAPDIDLIETGERQSREVAAAAPRDGGSAQDDDAADSGKSPYLPYAWTVAICILTALITTPMMPHLDLANIVMLFLLAEVLIAVRFGRGPAVLAAFLSVAVFDFFFVSPRFSFAVS